jgi:hypothetical protein
MWVIDDFLPPSLHNDLKNLLLGTDIGWTYAPGGTNHDTQDEFYFIHNVIADGYTSHLFKDIKPLLYFIDDRLGFVIDSLLRINCTLVTNQGVRKRTTMHVDMPRKQHYVGIYYINDNNGPTVVEDTEVECVANRFVLFEGSKMHCGTLQDDCHARVNIVFNMQGHFRK